MFFETESVSAFLDHNPASPYRAPVSPQRHKADLFGATNDALVCISAVIKSVVDLYNDGLGLESAEIASDSGSSEQQGVFHLHFHVAPRHVGNGQDMNLRTSSASRQDLQAMANARRESGRYEFLAVSP